MKTLKVWLGESQKILEDAGIATARLDCLVLVEDVIGKDRAWLLAHSETELNTAQLKILNSYIRRREGHEPLAYIRGKSWFYGREFSVNPHTLEPRPETETMIEVIKKLKLPKGIQIADVGAGSGVIGITLSLEIPNSKVSLYEISRPALKIAKQNTTAHGTKIDVQESDLLATAKDHQVDLVTANLPYVPDAYVLNKAAMYEPRLAIFGGADGLNIYRRLFEQLKARSQQPGFVVTESLPFQHAELVAIAQSASYRLKQTDDFIQLFQLA